MISFKNFIVENKPKGKDVLPDEPGHQTPGYYKGIKKKDKVARARHFARQGKMSDSDPSAYKKAPGDSEGPHGNKKSKHTLKVMKMYPSLYKDKKKTNESIIGMAKRAVKGIASDRKTGQALQHMHDVHKNQSPGNDSFNQMNRDKARHFQMALRHHNNGDIQKRNQHINRGLKWDKGYPDPRDVHHPNDNEHSSHRNHLSSVVGMSESAVYNIKYKKYDYGTPESVKYMKQMTPGQQVKEVLDTPAKRNAYKKANQKSHYTAAQRMAKNYPGTSQEYKDKKFRDNELQRMKRIKGFMAVTKKSGTTGYEKEQTNEAANYSVSIEGLPRIFMTSDSPSKLKQELRKIIRKPDMIQSVKRITDADVKKSFRLKAQGKEEPEQTNEGSESWKAGYSRRVVKTTKPEHKEKGYNWRIKGKDRPEISIKLYKEKPSQSEFNKQMKRVAGHEFGG